jgi:hypothetical protein
MQTEVLLGTLILPNHSFIIKMTCTSMFVMIHSLNERLLRKELHFDINLGSSYLQLSKVVPKHHITNLSYQSALSLKDQS